MLNQIKRFFNERSQLQDPVLPVAHAYVAAQGLE